MTDAQTINDRISFQINNGIAEIRLCRAARMNALDGAMLRALIEVLGLLAASDARVAVISGDGAAFCSGLDKAVFGQMLSGDAAEGIPADLIARTHGICNLPQHAVMGWRDLSIPVIAAVHGVAFGGGLQLALAADIRLVAPGTRLSLMEIRWGLIPDMGGMALLPRLIRDDVLRDLLFTGRKVLAAEAVALGLATRVAEDPREAALDLARTIVTSSPSALAAGKRLANLAGFQQSAALLRAESEEQQKLLGGADQREAIAAALGGRTPDFSNLNGSGLSGGSKIHAAQ